MKHGPDIHEQARGRWAAILPQVGVPASFLTGKHGPCPFCDGGARADRFRFDDKAGAGSYFCSKCGAGGGVDFVMKFKGWDFITAKLEIQKLIGTSPLVIPKAARSDTDMKARLADSWKRARPLDDIAPSTRYLRSRGIDMAQWPSQLRDQADCPFMHDDKTRTYHPAMVAKFVSADAREFILHRTFLTMDGYKADVPEVRKLAPGKVPQGGAVRLAPSGDTLGVGEGLETCLSAMLKFNIPVWACLTAGLLQKFQPPRTVSSIIIFGDNDASYTGQAAAFGLAYRLKTEGFYVDVRIPDEIGDDWNDEWMSDQRLSPPVRPAQRQENHHADEDCGVIEY